MQAHPSNPPTLRAARLIRRGLLSAVGPGRRVCLWWGGRVVAVFVVGWWGGGVVANSTTRLALGRCVACRRTTTTDHPNGPTRTFEVSSVTSLAFRVASFVATAALSFAPLSSTIAAASARAAAALASAASALSVAASLTACAALA